MPQPPSSPATLGLDLGTSAAKAVLVDADGGILAVGHAPLSLSTPGTLAAEQDAEAWWGAARSSIRACLEEVPDVSVAAVGLTGQKHALLALDAGGRPLAPAVLWADGRAVEEAHEQELLSPRLVQETGAPALPGYLVPKWLRWRRHHPDLAARTARLCFAKDWIRLCLTGAYATDPTEASASQLYDFRTRTWSEALCARFDVPRSVLPEIVPSSDVAGVVSPEGAEETGLRPGTPVVSGAGDNEAAAVACGALASGVVAVVLGTSGTIVAPARRRRRTPGLVWCRHATRRGLAATGVVLSCGRAVEWARQALLGDAGTIADLETAAVRGLAAASRPLFLPSLAGERSPVPDAAACGAFAGLRPEHGRDHLAASVYEGTAAALGEVVALLRRAGVPVQEIRPTSGGAASPAWRRLVVAAAGVPARPAHGREGPARGAALLAAVRGAPDHVLVERAARWSAGGEAETAGAGEIEHMRALQARLAALRTACGRVDAACRP